MPDLRRILGKLLGRAGEIRFALELIATLVSLWLLTKFGLIPVFPAILMASLAFLLWSARYGLVVYLVGLFVFQTLAILTEGTVQFSIGVRNFSVILTIFGLPIAVIGEVMNRRLNAVRGELEKARMSIERLEAELQRSRDIVEQLQLRIYYEGEGLIVLLERLRELEILDSEEIITRAVELIAEFFGLRNLHFYRLEGSFLRYVAGVGTKRLPNSLRVEESQVIRRALETGESTIADVIHEGIVPLEKEPFFAVAVGFGGEVLGIFLVEEITYEKFSQTLVRYVRAVGNWLHANLKLVADQERLLAQEYRNPDGTWKEEYYENRRRVMEKRRDLFGIPFQELCVRYDEKVHERIVREFRKSDVVTATHANGRVSLRVLLAVCDEVGATKVLERLRSKYGVSLCEEVQTVGTQR